MKIVKAKTIKGGLMGFGVLFGLIVAGQVAYPQIARAEASTQSVFIPAYTYPKTWQGGDNSYWNAITAAGGQKAPFVVVNPNSGSGDKVDQNYQKQIKNLEEAKINYIDQVELYANNRCIARGDVVVVHDNFGIRVTEVIGKN